MTSPVLSYQEEMYRNLGFFANWLPGDPIRNWFCWHPIGRAVPKGKLAPRTKGKMTFAKVGTKHNVQFTSTREQPYLLEGVRAY